jgi:hypothetical protein
MLTVVWTNGAVALTKDPIFGVSVKTETAWRPISQLDPEDLALVRRLVNWAPECPFKSEVYQFTPEERKSFEVFEAGEMGRLEGLDPEEDVSDEESRDHFDNHIAGDR